MVSSVLGGVWAVIGGLCPILYWGCKIFFNLMGIYYIYALITGEMDMYIHITGIMGLLFLISTIRWNLGGN